jgi:hypothetical protein
METEDITGALLTKSFIASLLLTKNAGQAESAVLESIRCSDLIGYPPAEDLFRGALKAALALRCEAVEQQSAELDYALSILPPELQHVLHLPTNLRDCFVLRILAGLPSDICARTLDLTACEVDWTACSAAQVLAGVDHDSHDFVRERR